MTRFSDALDKTIAGYLSRYETRRSAILPILHAIQDAHGWIHEEHIDELEKTYELSRIHVKEVISFYDIYRDRPTKKYVIRYCDNLTCRMMGSEPAMARIKTHLAAWEKTDKDGCPFELEPFPCLGKCDGAPVMLVNKDRVEHATEDKIDEILSRYASLPK